MYPLRKEEYNKLLWDTIASKYRRTNIKIKDKRNKKGKEVLKNKETLHQLDINKESNCFSFSRITKIRSKTTEQSD